MNKELLRENARKVVARSILAADESTNTIRSRFQDIGVESTPELNREWRLLLFQAPNVENFVSGVILFDETLRQKTDDGQPIPQMLYQKGIMPGIKVDAGTSKIPGFGTDTVTQGLDGMPKRLKEYKEEFGVIFAKSREMITIGPGLPKEVTINKNSDDNGLYAIYCQDRDIVPIVEPEVLMDGSHSFDDTKRTTWNVLKSNFKSLEDFGVDFGGMILKPNMVTPDKQHLGDVSAEAIARATLDVLQATVPPTVAGISFLSGDQGPEIATINLNAINRLKNENPTLYPWQIIGSFGRAYQREGLFGWKGKTENIPLAQTIFIARAEKIYRASLGKL